MVFRPVFCFSWRNTIVTGAALGVFGPRQRENIIRCTQAGSIQFSPNPHQGCLLVCPPLPDKNATKLQYEAHEADDNEDKNLHGCVSSLPLPKRKKNVSHVVQPIVPAFWWLPSNAASVVSGV